MYLDMTQHSGGVHPAGLVHCVAPDVEHRLGGPNDPADQRPHRHPYPEHEVVEGVLVDVVQLVVQLGGKVNEVTEMVVWIILEQRRVKESDRVTGKNLKLNYLLAPNSQYNLF